MMAGGCLFCGEEQDRYDDEGPAMRVCPLHQVGDLTAPAGASGNRLQTNHAQLCANLRKVHLCPQLASAPPEEKTFLSQNLANKSVTSEI
jgi:hypothetical protein